MYQLYKLVYGQWCLHGTYLTVSELGEASFELGKLGFSHIKVIDVNSDFVNRTCETCGNCYHIGDGDYYCNEMEKVVIVGKKSADDYMCCEGKEFITVYDSSNK